MKPLVFVATALKPVQDDAAKGKAMHYMIEALAEGAPPEEQHMLRSHMSCHGKGCERAPHCARYILRLVKSAAGVTYYEDAETLVCETADKGFYIEWRPEENDNDTPV